MKNYICLNGQKTELTKEKVEMLRSSLGKGQIELSNIHVGEPFTIGKYEFVVLEHSGDTSAVIFKGLLFENKEFGKNNNFDGSYVDDICKSFSKEIADIIGEGNLVEHTVDLTSDDGLKDYGKIKRKMSLLTCNQYRKYVEILDKFKLDKWWWLSTPWSTPTHSNSTWIKCVSPDGHINYDYYFNYYGVRPFCILKSNIFVSK